MRSERALARSLRTAQAAPHVAPARTTGGPSARRGAASSEALTPRNETTARRRRRQSGWPTGQRHAKAQWQRGITEVRCGILWLGCGCRGRSCSRYCCMVVAVVVVETIALKTIVSTRSFQHLWSEHLGRAVVETIALKRSFQRSRSNAIVVWVLHTQRHTHTLA